MEATCDVVELSAQDDYRRLLLHDKAFAARTAASMVAAQAMHPSVLSATASVDSARNIGPSSDAPIPPSRPSPQLPGGTFFHPLGPPTEANLDRAWAQLVAAAAPSAGAPLAAAGPCSIPVLFGRSLEVPMSAGGAARFRFEQLCAGPLGPADYVALAAAFHTVVVTDVPVMSMQASSVHTFWPRLSHERAAGKTALGFYLSFCTSNAVFKLQSSVWHGTLQTESPGTCHLRSVPSFSSGP